MVRARKQTPKQAKHVPPFTAEDVVATIEDMYVDELKPLNKLLRRRVFERINCSDSAARADVDMQALCQMCISCPLVSLSFEHNGDWYALLVGRPPVFVDINDTSDPYPAAMWDEFRAFCEGPQSHTLLLPGGRCAAAEELRALPYFATFSLGRLCHIVELALNGKKLLGYTDGAIVSYKCSERALKELSILQKTPSSASRMQVATLEVVRAGLQQLLEESPTGSLPLPNVKRLFGTKFKVQLSETVFGHSKVLDLLQDSRFKDICTVEMENGFTVKRKKTSLSIHDALAKDVPAPVAEVEKPHSVMLCAGVPLPMEEAEMLTGRDDPIWLVPSCMPAPLTSRDIIGPSWCLSPSTLSKDGYAGSVQTTRQTPPAPPPGLFPMRGRSKSICSDADGATTPRNSDGKLCLMEYMNRTSFDGGCGSFMEPRSFSK